MYDQMEKQFNYFLENHSEFVEKYDGKAVILHNFEVVGVYPDEFIAGEFAVENYEVGTFIVQTVSPDPASYTVSIVSAGQKL